MLPVASPLALVTALSIAALGIVITFLFDIWWGEVGGRSLALSAVLSVVAWVLCTLGLIVVRPDIDSRLVIPVVALAGLSAVMVSIPIRLLGLPTPALLLFSSVWVVAVYLPAAVALFSFTDGVLGGGLSTLDLGGALPTFVAAGAAGLAVLVLEGRHPVNRRQRTPRWWVLAIVVVIVWGLWIMWLVGLELAIDEITASIVLNAVITPVVACGAWLIVQRIRHARTTPVAAAGGVFCGLVAVTPACGYLDPVGAILTGAITGAVCSLVGYSLVRRSGQPSWMLVTVLIVSAGLSTTLLGAFATRAGLLFTGQPEVLYSQLSSSLLVAVYSAVVSMALWIPVRYAFGIHRRQGSHRVSV